MAEALISNPEANAQENGPSASPHPSSAGSLFHRRIDFHLTRKPYSGFTNGSGGFRLETLNPTTDPKRSGHSTGPAASSGKKQDGSDHVENGLDPELSIGITVRRIVSSFRFLWEIISGLRFFLLWVYVLFRWVLFSVRSLGGFDWIIFHLLFCIWYTS